jgi:hypothetical protein
VPSEQEEKESDIEAIGDVKLPRLMIEKALNDEPDLCPSRLKVTSKIGSFRSGMRRSFGGGNGSTKNGQKIVSPTNFGNSTFYAGGKFSPVKKGKTPLNITAASLNFQSLMST